MQRKKKGMKKDAFEALDTHGLGEKKEEVKAWYDGFTFGKTTDIYNPWSIIGFIKEKEFKTYWANTSSNSLAGQLIQKGDPQIKETMEDLLEGKTLKTPLDEQIVFSQLNGSPEAVWSMLLASGYLKIVSLKQRASGEFIYELALTNREVNLMFHKMIQGWFDENKSAYHKFIHALRKGDVEAMNDYMNDIALSCFSYFDTGKTISEKRQAERFYHGFVLGLLVDLREQYVITSNRESGYGRYDVTLEPRNIEDAAIIIEFKVRNERRENTLEDTLKAAREQIETMEYDAALMERGIPKENIRHYGFAFQGKTVLIG